MIDYLAVGNPTLDSYPDNELLVGGTVVYSTLQAAKLGLTAGFFGRGCPADFLSVDVINNCIDIRLQEAPTTTHFRNVSSAGVRHQTIAEWAGVIELPAALPARRILHIAPVAAELTAEMVAALGPAEFVGLTPQGLLRSWDAAGKVGPRQVEGAEELARQVHAVVVADYERPYAAPLLDRAVDAGALAVVTKGAAGCEVHTAAGIEKHPAVPAADLVDDCGAGDVFAAALFIELHRGAAVAEAVRFASAAAALSLRGIGVRGIGSRDEIDELVASAV